MAKTFVRRPRSFTWLMLVSMVVLMFALAACGDSGSSASTSTSSSGNSASSSGSSAPAATIMIKEQAGGQDVYSFEPKSTTIKAGQTVTFDNQSDEFHLLMTADSKGNAVTDAAPFTTTTIVPTTRGGGSATTLQVTFTTPGTYYYTSKLVKRPTDGQHPEGAMSMGMGTIVVN